MWQGCPLGLRVLPCLQRYSIPWNHLEARYPSGWGTGGEFVPTNKCCRLAPIKSCRLVLSSGCMACLYCHFSGTKGHCISLASCSRRPNSAGSKAAKGREQVRGERGCQKEGRVLINLSEANTWPFVPPPNPPPHPSPQPLARCSFLQGPQQEAILCLSGVALLSFALQVVEGQSGMHSGF